MSSPPHPVFLTLELTVFPLLLEFFLPLQPLHRLPLPSLLHQLQALPALCPLHLLAHSGQGTEVTFFLGPGSVLICICTYFPLTQEFPFQYFKFFKNYAGLSILRKCYIMIVQRMGTYFKNWEDGTRMEAWGTVSEYNELGTS